MSIPFDQITAYVEADQPLLEMASGDPDPVTDAIAESVGRFIGDGATLQIGLGKIPGAVLRTLRARRNLRIHSGLIGDAVVDLEEAGALAGGISVTAGVAIGTKRLYRAIQSEKYIFKPVAQTHDPHVMASLPDLVTINSALAVDLFGQCYAERANGAFVSGPGGASEFAAGAKLARGLRIIALPASAGGESRIVLSGDGPVSLSRMDTDIVVTEHGFADLRGLGHEGRAAALISLAPPDRRSELRASWEKTMRAAP
jgi:acyl-CoA hydrolase